MCIRDRNNVKKNVKWTYPESSGWHSGKGTIFGVLPIVLGSWWEISENGDRGSTQNFDARLVSIVVWPGEPFLEKLLRIRKYTLFQNRHVQKIKKIVIFPEQKPRRVRQDTEELFRLTEYGHWGPIIGIIMTQYRHWGPIIGLRLTEYGHWGPKIVFRMTD